MNKNELKVFSNEEFGEVRIVELKGKSYFIANDVAKALGYASPKDAITRHCKGATFRSYLTDGGKQKAKVIPEGDIYRLIVKSKLPSAEKFESWVFDDVLPTIRKTGGYVEDDREEEFIYKYFPSFSEDVKMSMVQDLLKTNKELKPKAEYFDKTLQPSNLKSVTDIAKDLGMSAQKLNKTLHKLKVIYPKKINGKIKCWHLYAKYEHLIPEFADYHISEYGQILKWNEKGRKFILELLEDNKDSVA